MVCDNARRFVQRIPCKLFLCGVHIGTQFFKIRPCWPQRHFKRPQVFHLNTKMVVKRRFSAFWWLWFCGEVVLYFERPFRVSQNSLKNTVGTYGRLKKACIAVFCSYQTYQNRQTEDCFPPKLQQSPSSRTGDLLSELTAADQVGLLLQWLIIDDDLLRRSLRSDKVTQSFSKLLYCNL